MSSEEDPEVESAEESHEAEPLDRGHHSVARSSSPSMESVCTDLTYSIGQKSSAESVYWAKMKEVAECELKLKNAQCEYESERIAMERSMHRQNLLLVDMRIRQQQILLENQKKLSNI